MDARTYYALAAVSALAGLGLLARWASDGHATAIPFVALCLGFTAGVFAGRAREKDDRSKGRIQ